MIHQRSLNHLIPSPMLRLAPLVPFSPTVQSFHFSPFYPVLSVLLPAPSRSMSQQSIGYVRYVYYGVYGIRSDTIQSHHPIETVHPALEKPPFLRNIFEIFFKKIFIFSKLTFQYKSDWIWLKPSHIPRLSPSRSLSSQIGSVPPSWPTSRPTTGTHRLTLQALSTLSRMNPTLSRLRHTLITGHPVPPFMVGPRLANYGIIQLLKCEFATTTSPKYGIIPPSPTKIPSRGHALSIVQNTLRQQRTLQSPLRPPSSLATLQSHTHIQTARRINCVTKVAERAALSKGALK